VAATVVYAQDTTTIPGVALDAKVMRKTAIGDIVVVSVRVELAKVGGFSAVGYSCQQLDAKGELVSKTSAAFFAPAFTNAEPGWVKAEENAPLQDGASKVECKLSGLGK
jgi:hypothetical protein